MSGTSAARVAAGLLLVLVVVDRYLWSTSQIWAIDDAFHVRLAESLPWRIPAVGILNTSLDPNPNGLTWLAWVLSPLPSLLAMSVALALGQAVVAVALVRAAVPPRGRLAVLLVLLASVHLRAVSPALWGQWLFVAINMLALAGVFAYLPGAASPKLAGVRLRAKAGRPVWFAISLACALAAPSFYLPGVINTICIVALWAFVLRHACHADAREITPARTRACHAEAREITPARRRARLGSVALVLVTVAVVLTFGPFVMHVDVFALQSMAERSLPTRVALAGLEAVTAPLSALRFAFGDVDLFAQPPGPEYGSLRLFMRASGMVLMIQAAVSVTALVWAMRRTPPRWLQSPTPLVLAATFVLLAHAVNTVVTGGAWYRDRDAGNSQQLLQFWPVVLFVVFAAPFFLADGSPVVRRLQRVTVALAVLFAFANVMAGERLLTGVLHPETGIVRRLDPPVVSLQRAADRVAEDWRARGPSSSLAAVPVEFLAQHVSVDWTDLYVPAHDRWHPRELKVGEAFDLVLDERHRLSNACGRRCPSNQSKYVIRVTGDPPPPGAGNAAPLWQDPWLEIWWALPE